MPHIEVEVDESLKLAGSTHDSVPSHEISGDSQPASFHSRVGSIPSPKMPGSTCLVHLDLTRQSFRDF